VRHSFYIEPRQTITFLSDRVVLASTFFALFCLNYAPTLLDALPNLFSLDNDLSHSRTVSSAEILGFAAIAVVLSDLKSDRVLRWLDYVATIGIAIACVYPSQLIRAIAVTGLGLLFVARSDKRLASLGQLCIGLVWIDFWGPLVLESIKQWLLPLEADFAFVPLSVFGWFALDGTVISNNGGFAIQVAEPCSAFHNTITTAFIWLALMKIIRAEFHLRHYCFLAIALAFVVLLNTARISIMAVSESQYLFWHVGPGLWIVKVTMLGTMLGLFYLCARTPHQEKLSLAA
jgi:hypothetical protein